MDREQAAAKVAAFRQRLNILHEACAEVAAGHGARFERGSSIQEPFSSEMSTGSLEELPTARMVKGHIEVDIRPSEISMDLAGRYFAKLSVGRTITGAGRLTSPSCWTDLDDPDDPRWYAGAVGNKERPVDQDLITSWLHHRGPRPIW